MRSFDLVAEATLDGFNRSPRTRYFMNRRMSCPNTLRQATEVVLEDLLRRYYGADEFWHGLIRELMEVAPRYPQVPGSNEPPGPKWGLVSWDSIARTLAVEVVVSYLLETHPEIWEENARRIQLTWQEGGPYERDQVSWRKRTEKRIAAREARESLSNA